MKINVDLILLEIIEKNILAEFEIFEFEPEDRGFRKLKKIWQQISWGFLSEHPGRFFLQALAILLILVGKLLINFSFFLAKIAINIAQHLEENPLKLGPEIMQVPLKRRLPNFRSKN